MNHSQVIDRIEEGFKKKEIPLFRIGDSIRVHTRIIEGNKERVQIFTGTVIARKGTGVSETFTVYRNAYGSCMERVFLLHSPKIAKIEVTRSGKVRRAKLYYLRGASGKAARIREKIGQKLGIQIQVKTPPASAEEQVSAAVEEKKEEAAPKELKKEDE